MFIYIYFYSLMFTLGLENIFVLRQCEALFEIYHIIYFQNLSTEIIKTIFFLWRILNVVKFLIEII
jgi:hypothetical protein